MKRREFVKSCGAAVVVASIPSFAMAEGYEGYEEYDVNDMIVVNSGPSLTFPKDTGHHHELWIPKRLFTGNGNSGWWKSSTPWNGAVLNHRHSIEITSKDIRALKRGEEIILSDNNNDHEWIVYITDEEFQDMGLPIPNRPVS